jgi:hypothetical protein
VTDPEAYERKRRMGEYACDPNQSPMPAYKAPSPNLPPGTYFLSDIPQANKGEWEEKRSVGESGSASASPTEPPQEARLTLGSTAPTIYGCSPKPQCFDVCCIFRSTLILIVHIIQMLARFMNGLIQGSHTLQGTMQDYPYFTGEFGHTPFFLPTFESDVVGLVLDLFVPITCACDVLNLIIPVTPSAFTQGRPDICCFIQRISELIACIIMVLINSINSLAMGNTTFFDPKLGRQTVPFEYFIHSGFKNDVNTLFDIMLAVVECLCIFVRAVFPLDYIPGFSTATNFDICCAGQVLLDTIIEIARLVTQIIISLATITIDNSSFCYWRLDQTVDHACGGTLDEIGVIKQLDVVIDTFLPRHGEGGGACLAVCHSDDGATGIVPCICQILNTLVPFRPHPELATNCNPDPLKKNCPILDLCCPFAKLGFALADGLKFVNRGVAAFWQSWDGGLPEFFVHYIWCAEPTIPPCTRSIDPFTNMIQDTHYIAPEVCQEQVNKQIPQCLGTRPVLDANSVIQMRCGEFTCGKFNIVISDLTDPFEGLIAKCICQIFSLLDELLAFIFNFLHIVFPQAGWSCCFCGGLALDGGGNKICNVNDINPCNPGAFNSGSGVLPAVSYIIEQVLLALTNLARQFPLSCYWRPAYPNVPHIISETWIFSFLAPTADALCIASGNLVCFAESMFLLPSTCLARGEKFMGGIVRWVAEIILRVIGFIEAFIESFITSPNTCVGPNCDQKAGSKQQTSMGVNAKPLGNMLVILLSIPIDLLIGDADVSCTTICPSILANPTPSACGCWNLSPGYINNGATQVYIPTTDMNICTDPMTMKHVSAAYGRTDVCCYAPSLPLGSHLPGALPICQSPDDTQLQLAVPGYNYTQLFNVNASANSYVYAGSNIPYVEPPYPGSCAALSACRPDALPSCANDKNTPEGLAANYRGALDGIVMAFLKYLRCLLNNLLGCDGNGQNCVQLGIIFYPAIIIFSISWQILGGVIRFIASTIIFLFSLFTPPTGGACSCWEQGLVDGYNNSLTQYYEQVGGLCYACHLLGFKCDATPTVGTIVNNACSRHWYPCAPYCPYNQKILHPTIDAATALTMCMADFLNTSSHNNAQLTALQACTGHIQHMQVCDLFNPSNPQPCINYFDPVIRAAHGDMNPNITTGIPFSTAAGTGLCLFYTPTGYKTDRRLYGLLDACPDPHCQFNAPPVSLCNTMASGFWPCGGGFSIMDNTYPDQPLVVCGVLQIVSNFLDIFTAFDQIFTTPLFISPQSRSLRGGVEGAKRFIGPVSRESRQAFNKRFTGTVYGATNANNNVGTTEALVQALYNYDTSDCYHDPITCACRNFDMSGICTVNSDGQVVFGPLAAGKKRQSTENMTHTDMIQHMSETMFTGTTVCDTAFATVAGQDWHTNVTMNDKHHIVTCVDQKIQGSRLSTVADVFPDDIMYNTQAPLTLVNNIFHTVRTNVQRRFTVSAEQKTDARAEMERRFPRFGEQLANRTKFAERVLIDKHGIKPTSLMFDAALKADRIWFKYQTGFYSFAFAKTVEGLASGKSILPTTYEAAADMKHAVIDLKNVIFAQPYKKLYDASYESATVIGRTLTEALDEGALTWIKRHYNRHIEHRRSIYSESAAQKKAERFERAFYASPIYKWWNHTYSAASTQREPLLAPFVRHLSSVYAFQREHWQDENFSFFNADLKFWSVADVFKTRWSNPVYKPEQLENWHRLKRTYYQFYNYLWPGQLSHDLQERFLFNSNCIIADRAAAITIKVIDYCSNEFFPNYNFTKRHIAPFYFGTISRYRNDTYYGYNNRHRFVEQRTIASDPDSYIRPRLIEQNRTIPDTHKLDYRVYRRAVTMERHGPSGFNLFDWLIVVIEDWTGWAFGAQADTWFDDVKNWLLNPNTNVQQYPDVGLAYALKFEFVCNFPENLNCSIGIGLEQALLWVTVGFVGLFVVSAYILPVVMFPFYIVGLGVSYWIVFLAVAWHLPLSCVILFPSFPLPFGIALPSCAMDQIVAFLDKWITNCYSPLILPAYMIAGEVCPTDPHQSIDVLNCRDVGVSDGLQNLLYLGFWLFGNGFVDLMLQITATWIGSWIPGTQQYMETTLHDFQTSSDTNKQRLTFCFWATLPTLMLPLTFLFIAGVGLALLIPAILILVNALVGLFFASPAAAAMGSAADTSDWFGNKNNIPEKPLPKTSRKKTRGKGTTSTSASPVAIAASVFRRLFFSSGSGSKKSKQKLE